MFKRVIQLKFALLLTVSLFYISGCGVEAAKNTESEKSSVKTAETVKLNEKENISKDSKIEFEANSPADTVRVFYKNLREKRFREALFLTNLRPAIEGLTEAEMDELKVNFEDLAVQVPAKVEINGEIIAGEKATVTANLPDNETGKISLQEIKLQKSENVWVILTVDEETEKLVKKEGKNYFFSLRMETYQAEAPKLLEKISKAQMAYAVQNNGVYTDLPTLIESGLISQEIFSPNLTGYNFVVKTSDNKRQYFVTATPATYGKTGKLSFVLELDDTGKMTMNQKDKSGQPLKK
jgi:hypothetical protein